MSIDFTADDERLLTSLFPEDTSYAVPGVSAPPFPPSTPIPKPKHWTSQIILISLLIALVITVIGVDIAFKRIHKSALRPPWLQFTKMVAGIASFYLTYYSLEYTLENGQR
jgi:hypothetical protein